MNVILTGACGHIGSYFVSNFYKIKKIKKLYLVDNLKSNKHYTIFNLANKKNVSFHEVDVAEKNSLNIFKDATHLIHCASMTNAEKSFSVKKSMFDNNLNCMKTVINFCKTNNVKLIHLSSTSVYGKQAKVVDENCEKKFLKPQSPYAEIKLQEENMLKKTKKLFYITYRLGTISGYSKGIRFHTAVNKFCFNAALGQEISVYKTALNQFRPYLSIRDCFILFKFTLEKNFFKNDIYNALTDNFTVSQIISKIKKRKKNIKIKFINSPIMNQLSYHVDKKKLSKFGLKLNSNLQKDIDDTLNLFKNLKN